MQRGTRTMLWTILAAVSLSVGTGARPATATDYMARKLAVVERFGLPAADPLVAESVEHAKAILSVDVRETLEGVTVTIHTSGQPEHRAVIFQERRRYVVDFFDTLNIAGGGPWDLGPDSPIRGVRHSQYQIQPDYISRVVCDLAPNVEPELVETDAGLELRLAYADATSAGVTALAPEPAPAAPDASAPVIMEATQVEEMGGASPDFAMADDAPPAPVATDEPVSRPEAASAPWWETEADTPAATDQLAASVMDQPATLEPQAAAESVEQPEPAWWLANDTATRAPADSPPADAPPASAPAPTADLPEQDEPTPPQPLATDAAEPAPLPEPQVGDAAPAQAAPLMAEAVAVDAWEEPVGTAPEAADASPAPVELPVDATPEPLQPEASGAVEPVALTETVVDEPVMEELGQPAAEPSAVEDVVDAPVEAAAEDVDEPVRVEVEETIETPSMVDLPPPVVPELAPIVDEPAMAEPLVAEPSMPSMFQQPAQAAAAPTAAGGAPFEETVTLTFRDADLNAVLDIISRKGKINILAGRDVSGRVTVRLVEVPLDVALDSVLNVNGYGYIKTNNIYRIVPLSQIGGDEVETVTEAFELSYANADDVKTTITDFLTRNGSVSVDKRTNLLIVTDVPGAVQRVAELIPQVDRRVQQVLIEVVILDSVLSDNADLGIQWSAFDRSDSVPGLIGSRPTDAGGSRTDGVSINLPSAAAGGGLGILVGTLIGDIRLSAFIEAQVVNSNARVLANPKLLTLDNETANIDIVEEFPFQDITQTSAGGQLSNISFKEIGTKLKVTPQITNDGYVILDISPEQSSIIEVTPTGVPRVATRRANTTLLVQDHQTVVLGGLRINRKTLSQAKVPGLGDVPAVKLLFRSTSQDESDTEILVFLTSHIVESPPIRPHERLVYDELGNMPRKPNSSPALFR